MKPGRFHTDSMPEQSAFASESQVLIWRAFLMRGARCCGGVIRSVFLWTKRVAGWRYT